ncbi:putative cellulose synthase (UDP-forming) [Rosa chinensis]|uniref:Putative cellulose synthase (UDP-forming) n=1 Tax=Rosa chinensis TaxID=74649 RepID=A0A2P6QLU3_ROSCH|nr:putative cellulose synthase (UDP-forming) [Rosa chinensis]
MGLLGAELWFGLYWILTQSCRWNLTFRQTFKDRLSQRFENELPGVDIFVTTADPIIEPPMMVMNTVLSVMAYDYPTEKISVYLSDDGGSELTYYALLEAAEFAKQWIPYCKKYSVEPRSPVAYFVSIATDAVGVDDKKANDLAVIKKSYKDMETKIENAVKLGHIPEKVRSKQKGFSQWDSHLSKRDHDTYLQVVIDGRDPKAIDVEGLVLPTLVYLAREKRPQYHHNFKAGSMNALIRVSSNISNGKVILNVDCDMYSNNSMAIRDALCCLMDEEKGHEVAFIQFPQNFENLTKNELYISFMRTISEVELHALDGFDGPFYVGSGCFHRRDTLCGRKFTKGCKSDMKWEISRKREETTIHELEEDSKVLANCAYEQNTEWGKEMGLKYGCAIEDVFTGLSIQCRGWRSVYLNPTRKAFLGVAPTTLLQMLVQQKRWSEGSFQILLSRHNPAFSDQISLGQKLGYAYVGAWSMNFLPTLFYTVIPSLYLLKGISLFPRVSSPWIIPFAYVIIAKYTGSFLEFLWAGGSALGWWNDQRMWLYKRSSSYIFSFIDTILYLLGYSDSAFVITAKTSDEDESQRYEKEIMEFGASSPLFSVLASLAVLNLYCFAGFVKEAISLGSKGGIAEVYDTMALQILLCGILILINLPLYQALYLRKDKGKLPGSIALKSMAFGVFGLTCFNFSY